METFLLYYLLLKLNQPILTKFMLISHSFQSYGTFRNFCSSFCGCFFCLFLLHSRQFHTSHISRYEWALPISTGQLSGAMLASLDRAPETPTSKSLLEMPWKLEPAQDKTNKMLCATQICFVLIHFYKSLQLL